MNTCSTIAEKVRSNRSNRQTGATFGACGRDRGTFGTMADDEELAKREEERRKRREERERKAREEEEQFELERKKREEERLKRKAEREKLLKEDEALVSPRSTTRYELHVRAALSINHIPAAQHPPLK